MTQSLTQRDRFITGLQVNLRNAITAGMTPFTFPYEGTQHTLMNTNNMHRALRHALDSPYPTAFVVSPYQVSRTRETLRGGSVRVFSGSESAIANTIEEIDAECCAAVVLWRLFPSQQKLALRKLRAHLPTMFTVVVEDETLKALPLSDTRTVLPENRVTKEKAAQLRKLRPYTLTNAYTDESSVKEPEVVEASSSRAHCRLCGTVIQPHTPCVRYYQFTPGMPSRVRTPQACYLHNFDCTQPGQVLFIDTVKGYAVVTNTDGLPTEVKLLSTKYDPETGQILHETLDIHAPIE